MINFSKSSLVAAMPTIWYLLAYIGTTVAAGMFYAVVPGGTAIMKVIGIDIPSDVSAEIGTPLYFSLLLLPLLIVPITAFAANRVAARAMIPMALFIPEMRINRAALVGIAVASFGFCLFRLYQFDALNLDVLACGQLHDKLQTRMSLLNGLGYPFFFFAYGVNMILPILAYVAYDKQGREKIDFLIFVACLVGLAGIVALTYSKSPLLVFAIMMTTAVLAARSPLKYLVMTAVLCFGVFFGLSAVINASESCAPPTNVATATYTLPIRVASDASPSFESLLPITDPSAPPDSALTYIGKLVGYGVVQRMASGLPYYIHLYQDESARCGLHGIIRRSIGLGPQKCELSVDVFRAMWPSSPVAGQQPAPAHIAAFGEIGFAWAISVMVLSGLFLGTLGAISATGRGPLFIAFGAAASGFAYYLTQVPFFASFTYPHGLIAFISPVGLLALLGLFRTRKRMPDAT